MDIIAAAIVAAALGTVSATLWTAANRICRAVSTAAEPAHDWLRTSADRDRGTSQTVSELATTVAALKRELADVDDKSSERYSRLAKRLRDELRALTDYEPEQPEAVPELSDDRGANTPLRGIFPAGPDVVYPGHPVFGAVPVAPNRRS